MKFMTEIASEKENHPEGNSQANSDCPWKIFSKKFDINTYPRAFGKRRSRMTYSTLGSMLETSELIPLP